MTDPGTRMALVSGGSRGIGRAVVHALARDGFDVAFCFRSDEDSAAEVEKTAACHGVRIRSWKVDVANAEAVRAFAAEAQEELGPVEAVVTAAGITRDNPLVLMDDAQWHDVIDTNLTGVYNVCRSVVFDMMKRKSGAIVNISSVAGVYGHAGQTNYAASKAGIIGLSRSLAKEMGRSGVRVNTVAPGFVDTDMVGAMTDRARQTAMAGIPLRRMGRPEEVAEAVSYLVSDRAAYVTGAVLQIDGGIAL